MAGLKREARLRAYLSAIHVLARSKTWMPGIADKLTQSAQNGLLWPGMTSAVKDPI
jgi:hypothetical protein